MIRYTQLEKAVLDWMAENLDIPNLAEQIQAAVPTEREYTGRGFFTTISVPSDIPRIGSPSPIDGPMIESDGIEYGGAAILFLDDGYIKTLEMYANGDRFAETITDFRLKAGKIEHPPCRSVYLFIKVCLESLEKASEFLEKEPNLIHEKTDLGETPLHYLAVENKLEAVKFLFSRGADLNTVNKCGGSPLSEAASLGYTELVKFLLENGAKIDSQLFGFAGIGTIIHEAVSSGNPIMIDLLSRYGADINARNSLEETPLHESAKDDERLEVTKYLLQHGVAIDISDGFNSTPLHTAILHGCIKTVRYLVKSGASLYAIDSKGRTPIQLARERKHFDIVDLLTEKSHEVKLYDKQ